MKSKTFSRNWLHCALKIGGNIGSPERFCPLVLPLVFGFFVLFLNPHKAVSTSGDEQSAGTAEMTRPVESEIMWGTLDPGRVSTVTVTWPENNTHVPSHTKLGTQCIVGLAQSLPPTRVWLKYCLLFYKSNETDGERTKNNCTLYRESSTPEHNVIVPQRIGKHKLTVHTKICFLEISSKCLFGISPPVFFDVYPSSSSRSFDEIFAGLAKLESSGARELEPRSFQPLRPDGLHHQYDLVLLSPDKTITVDHQLPVQYIFDQKESRQVVPVMPGKICFNLISDQSHMTDMVTCATVPGSSTRIPNDIIRRAGYLPSETSSDTSPGGRLLFLWADKEDTTSKFEKNLVKDYSKHVFGKNKWADLKVKPGLVYLMASFYHDSMSQAEHVQSRNIEPIIGEEADLVSTFTTWFFSNSFIYDHSFSPKEVTEVELERKSIIHENGNARSRNFSKRVLI